MVTNETVIDKTIKQRRQTRMNYSYPEILLEPGRCRYEAESESGWTSHRANLAIGFSEKNTRFFSSSRDVACMIASTFDRFCEKKKMIISISQCATRMARKTNVVNWSVDTWWRWWEYSFFQTSGFRSLMYCSRTNLGLMLLFETHSCLISIETIFMFTTCWRLSLKSTLKSLTLSKTTLLLCPPDQSHLLSYATRQSNMPTRLICSFDYS